MGGDLPTCEFAPPARLPIIIIYYACIKQALTSALIQRSLDLWLLNTTQSTFDWAGYTRSFSLPGGATQPPNPLFSLYFVFYELYFLLSFDDALYASKFTPTHLLVAVSLCCAYSFFWLVLRLISLSPHQGLGFLGMFFVFSRNHAPSVTPSLLHQIGVPKVAVVPFQMGKWSPCPLFWLSRQQISRSRLVPGLPPGLTPTEISTLNTVKYTAGSH
jgi:hypothetical protein